MDYPLEYEAKIRVAYYDTDQMGRKNEMEVDSRGAGMQ